MWPFSKIDKLKDELEYAKVRMAEDDIEFSRLKTRLQEEKEAVAESAQLHADLLNQLTNEKATSASLLTMYENYQIPPAVQEQLNRIEAMLTALTAEEAKK
jgi:hypothetical protein